MYVLGQEEIQHLWKEYCLTDRVSWVKDGGTVVRGEKRKSELRLLFENMSSSVISALTNKECNWPN